MKLCHIFTSSKSAFFFMDGQFQFMVDNGIETTVLVPNDGFYTQLISKYPMVTFVKSPIVRKISLLNDVKTLLFFIFHLLKHRFDIVHLHTPKAGLLGGLAARMTLCRRIIFHLHGLVSVRGGEIEKNLTYFMEKISLFIPHEILAVSNSLMYFCIEKKLCKSNKISVLNNGTINGIDINNRFNAELISPISIEFRTKLHLNEKFIIGFLGRINFDKGIKDIISCFKEVYDKNDSVYLLIIGDNEIGEKLFDLLAILPSHSYQVMPQVDNPAVYLSMFDLQLCPSYREGFGLVFAEASALGTPSVAYDIFGVSDAIDNGKTGTLVKFGDVKSLVLSIFNYIDNPDLLSSHSLAGIEYVVHNFKQQPILQAQLNYYKVLINDEKAS